MTVIIDITTEMWYFLEKKSNLRKKKLKKTQNVTKKSMKNGRKKKEKKRKSKLEGWKKNTWVATKQIRKLPYLQSDQFLRRKYSTI